MIQLVSAKPFSVIPQRTQDISSIIVTQIVFSALSFFVYHPLDWISNKKDFNLIFPTMNWGKERPTP